MEHEAGLFSAAKKAAISAQNDVFPIAQTGVQSIALLPKG
jgi:hypothetical protein